MTRFNQSAAPSEPMTPDGLSAPRSVDGNVVDGRNGPIVGNVEGLSAATHGIGISTANGRGYSDAGKVTVIDPAP